MGCQHMLQQERRNLTLAHLRRMTPVVKDDEPAYPIDISGFRAPTIATRSKAVPHPFEQSQLSLWLRRAPKVGKRYLGEPG